MNEKKAKFARGLVKLECIQVAAMLSNPEAMDWDFRTAEYCQNPRTGSIELVQGCPRWQYKQMKRQFTRG